MEQCLGFYPQKNLRVLKSNSRFYFRYKAQNIHLLSKFPVLLLTNFISKYMARTFVSLNILIQASEINLQQENLPCNPEGHKSKMMQRLETQPVMKVVGRPIFYTCRQLAPFKCFLWVDPEGAKVFTMERRSIYYQKAVRKVSLCSCFTLRCVARKSFYSLALWD